MLAGNGTGEAHQDAAERHRAAALQDITAAAEAEAAAEPDG